MATVPSAAAAHRPAATQITYPGLYAPTAEQVELVIAGQEQAVPLQRSDDGWWRDPDEGSFEPGTGYRFRVRADSWIRDEQTVEVVDPEARKVSTDGQWAEASSARVAYAWEHDGTPLPDARHLAIYEVYVQDFKGGQADGTFECVIGRLDYLQDLGITALELLPVKRGPAMSGWGYTPVFFFAIEPRFGTPEQLCRLIDEAHARGIAVILDGIYNHAHGDNPLAHIDHDCWFHHQPKDPDNAWGPQFNYDLNIPGTDQFPARSFTKRHMGFWIESFHVDGIRFDAVAQIDHPSVLGEFRTFCHERVAGKPFACIAERLPERPDLVGPDGCMDCCWRDSFCLVLRSVLAGEWSGEDLERIVDPRRDGFLAASDVVNYLSSHDRGHTLRHLLDAGIAEDDALRRSQLGYAVLLTSVGTPMLWMGDEFGAMDPPNQSAHPLPWELLDDPRRVDLHHRIRALLALRREHGCLRGDNCAILHRDDEARILVYQRWDDAGGRILVAVHAGDGDQGCRLAAPAPGRWHEVLLDFDLAEEDGHVSLQLAPWQAQVFVHSE